MSIFLTISFAFTGLITYLSFQTKLTVIHPGMTIYMVLNLVLAAFLLVSIIKICCGLCRKKRRVSELDLKLGSICLLNSRIWAVCKKRLLSVVGWFCPLRSIKPAIGNWPLVNSFYIGTFHLDSKKIQVFSLREAFLKHIWDVSLKLNLRAQFLKLFWSVAGTFHMKCFKHAEMRNKWKLVPKPCSWLHRFILIQWSLNPMAPDNLVFWNFLKPHLYSDTSAAFEGKESRLEKMAKSKKKNTKLQ